MFERFPALLRALEWVRSINAETPNGIIEIEGKDLYGNVHGYETVPVERCKWESHRSTIDLQVCLAGGEIIEFAGKSRLQPAGEYNPTKDVEFWTLTGQSEAQLRMEPGSFALFLPDEPHMPKLADGVNSSVKKVVVKIAAHLLD